MHVPDGILPPPVTLGALALTAGVTALCARQIARRPDPRRDLPKAAMLSATFFAATLVHLPVPPVSVHLMLNGLTGVLLGWFAFPAILVALALQAVMFGHGGLTTLGVNALIQGLPALAAFGLVSALGRRRGPAAEFAVDFAAGAGAVALSVLLFAVLLLTNLPARLDAATERHAIAILALAHVPAMLAEGLVVAATVRFLRRVRPEMLHGL